MIGVIAGSPDHSVVQEFFELFKTPWEFYRKDRKYDVVVCSGDCSFDGTAKLVLFYAGRKIQFDDGQQVQIRRQRLNPCFLSYRGYRIPIYGNTIAFSEKAVGTITHADSEESAAYLSREGERVWARIGYDIFSEVRALLTVGQPHANAQWPALELHIAFLRDTITGCGVPLVEIPPVPDGFQFIACLTHDVDHPSICQHKWDRTVLGFLFRAMPGSLFDFIRGRIPIKDLLANWGAAFRLPLVYLGLARDFWLEFDRRYLELEKGHQSTFFLIPFRNRAGKKHEGAAPAYRAARYDARDIEDTIRNLMEAGCEVGLHGIDAWLDSSKGREELGIVHSLTGGSEIGVRMHWLYFDPQSPQLLEAAGAAYDSTVGYNETVGYRAGTTQVYKPLCATHLLELPLHVMDTALFYLSYLGLSPERASSIIKDMTENVVRFGGVLTINWHDRSVVPERLWGTFYRNLIEDLQSRSAWLSTAGQTVSWFRKRRSAKFEVDSLGTGAVRTIVVSDQCDQLPRMRLRIHKGGNSEDIDAPFSESYVDTTLVENLYVGRPA